MKYFYCSDIEKKYQDSSIIKNIDIKVDKGEVVSILGQSGVGKTTLFQILSGVEKPDRGVVYLNNNNITGIPGKVAYMQQKDLLLPFKTVMNNVILPMVVKGMPKEQAKAKAGELMELFGLAGYEDSYPNQLSGGMKQRAAFLRTFLDEKKIMLLDEPFSALDLKTKKDMYKWFLNVTKKFNLTVLFISHDIDETLLLADRVYIIAGVPGKIAKAVDTSGIKNGRGSSEEQDKIKLDIINSMSI